MGGTEPSTGPALRPLEPSDWAAVAEIYRQGIASGHATFETVVPSWEAWDGSRHPRCRIVAVADHFAEPYVARGELTPVLPEWNLPAAAAWAVFPGRRLMPARTRVFLDALAAEFIGPRCTAQHEKMARMRTAARG